MDIRRPVFLKLRPQNVAVISDKYVAVISYKYMGIPYNTCVAVLSDKYVGVISYKYVAVISNGRRHTNSTDFQQFLSQN